MFKEGNVVELAVYPTLSPAQDSPHGGASQPVANEDNISGLRSGILNKKSNIRTREIGWYTGT